MDSEIAVKGLTDTQETCIYEALMHHYRDGTSLNKAFEEGNMRRSTYYALRTSCPDAVENIHDRARVDARLERALVSKEFETYRHLLSEAAQRTAADLVVENLQMIGSLANGSWQRRIKIPAKEGETKDTFKTIRANPRDMLGAQKYLTQLAIEGLEGAVLPQNPDGALDDLGIVLPSNINFSRLRATTRDGQTIEVSITNDDDDIIDVKVEELDDVIEGETRTPPGPLESVQDPPLQAPD